MSRVPMSQPSSADYGRAAEAWAPQIAPRGQQKHKKPVRCQANVRFEDAPITKRAPQRDMRANSMSRVLMYCTLALALALVFTQIGRLAQIAGQTKQISALTSNIRELQNEKNNLQVRLSMQQNINRVRDEAVYNLGMVRPDDEQIRVVSLNAHSANALTQTADGAAGKNATE